MSCCCQASMLLIFFSQSFCELNLIIVSDNNDISMTCDRLCISGATQIPDYSKYADVLFSNDREYDR